MDSTGTGLIVARELTDDRDLNVPAHSLIERLQPDERIRGRYRLMRIRRRTNQKESEFWQVDLADRSGAIVTFGWPAQWELREAIDRYAIVEAEFTTRQDERIVGELRGLDVVLESDPVEAVDLLPAPLCPRPELLGRLATIVQAISIVPLRRFVGRMLTRDDLAFRFLSAPASVRHHHNYPAGLLAHSVEVGEILLALPFPSRRDQELALVAGLFHDIGKIWTLDHQMRMTELGNLVTHDGLTLEICASALAELDREWRDGAMMLRHVWTCASSGARYGMQAQSAVADAVRLADRLSAERGKDALAFATSAGKHAFHTAGRRWRART